MNVSESMTARDFYNFASQHYEEIKFGAPFHLDRRLRVPERLGMLLQLSF